MLNLGLSSETGIYELSYLAISYCFLLSFSVWLDIILLYGVKRSSIFMGIITMAFLLLLVYFFVFAISI